MGKEFNSSGGEILGTIDRGDYWKVMFHEREIKISELERSIKSLKKQMLFKDIQLLQVSVNSYDQSIKQAHSEVKNAREQYENVRDKVSENLGYQLKDCIIDSTTLEVARYDDTPSDAKDSIKGV